MPQAERETGEAAVTGQADDDADFTLAAPAGARTAASGLADFEPGPMTTVRRAVVPDPRGTDTDCLGDEGPADGATGAAGSPAGPERDPRDHMESEAAGVAGVSDRGLRHHHNEDFLVVDSAALPGGPRASVAVVCDGVSSAERSELASEAACSAARTSLSLSLGAGLPPQQAMRDALLAAGQSVASLAGDLSGAGGADDPADERNAPACTIVSAVVTDTLLTVGWVGDSRAYWVPDDRAGSLPARLTEDDSWAAQMVAAGLLSEAEALADARAHAITGWLGADASALDPHTAAFEPDRPGVLVVCTDGLWNYADSAEEMAAVVPADAGTRPLAAAQHLVRHALDSGGHDNISVALLPYPADRAG
jgi:serine/threonine protein phosphatase PrpC